MTRTTAAGAAASLRGLMRTIERLKDVPRRTAVVAAPALTALLRQQFSDGTDPYGRAWNPLMQSTLDKGREPPPLTDGEKLRDGTRATPYSGGRSGIRLRIGAPYGKFHQLGFRVGKTKVKPRRIFPINGLPAAWSKAIHDAARIAFKRAAS